jgi:SpoVK/Ycf46/Vps4 family AAA+-type ATPase
LDKNLVQPIISDRRGLPSGAARTVSVVLFGPPGSSKTTIAKAVADGLRWPIVLLNPGNFIERGLEYIETQARSVFDRLLQLSRAVVVFDECDELFRAREPRPESEQMRGITAFVTASMLPKLQELHDRGRVVFFICTNNFESLDSAVKRGGRIDHIVGVGPPDTKAREGLITDAVVKLRRTRRWREPAYLDEASKELVRRTERFTRPELERALKALARLASESNWKNAKTARSATAMLARSYRGGLTITPSEYKKFTAQCKSYSHAHGERS